MDIQKLILTLLGIIISTGSINAQPKHSFHLINQENLTKLDNIDPKFDQERLKEFNENYDGLILTSKENLQTQFVLLEHFNTPVTFDQ